MSWIVLCCRYVFGVLLLAILRGVVLSTSTRMCFSLAGQQHKFANLQLLLRSRKVMKTSLLCRTLRGGDSCEYRRNEEPKSRHGTVFWWLCRLCHFIDMQICVVSCFVVSGSQQAGEKLHVWHSIEQVSWFDSRLRGPCCEELTPFQKLNLEEWGDEDKLYEMAVELGDLCCQKWTWKVKWSEMLWDGNLPKEGAVWRCCEASRRQSLHEVSNQMQGNVKTDPDSTISWFVWSGFGMMDHWGYLQFACQSIFVALVLTEEHLWHHWHKSFCIKVRQQISEEWVSKPRSKHETRGLIAPDRILAERQKTYHVFLLQLTQSDQHNILQALKSDSSSFRFFTPPVR